MNPPQKTGVIPKPTLLQKPAATQQKPASGPASSPDGRQQFKASGATMRPQTAEERRRAQRVLVKMPVLVHVQGGKPKTLEGFTHTVSASGAMIILQEGLAQGTKVTVENTKTQKKIDATVVRPPQMNNEGSLVPVEFSAPSPQFWNIFFPPTSN